MNYIERAKEIHYGKYNYSHIKNLVKRDTRVKIECPIHGIFEQSFNRHLYGDGCQSCSKESNIQYNKLDKHTLFIQRSVKIWGNKYDYSNVVYIDSKNKVRIICNLHGEFEQYPSNHYRYGCGSCGRESNVRNKELRQSCKENFVEKANNIHNNKYLYLNSEYIDAVTKVTVTCSMHGNFEVSPNNHLRGKGCPKCGKEVSRLAKLKPLGRYIIQFKTLYGDKYDYSEVKWNGSSFPISVRCKDHDLFVIIPYQHIKGKECPKCSNQYSKVSIEWLTYMEITYNTHILHALNCGEFRIPNTRYKADGYSKQHGIIFEFQGDFWHGNPTLYDPNNINPRSGISYGDLFMSTKVKMAEIRNQGYIVVSCWESEWIRFKKSIIVLQKLWKVINKYHENKTSKEHASIKND